MVVGVAADGMAVLVAEDLVVAASAAVSVAAAVASVAAARRGVGKFL
jgi:hypothetical protein